MSLAINKWKNISKNIQMSENTIRKNQNKVYWKYIFKYQNLSVDFIIEFIDKVEEYDMWEYIVTYQNLTTNFIRTYKDNLNWKLVCLYQDITDRFEPKLFAKIISVTNDTDDYFKIYKSDINFDIRVLNTTGITVYSSDIAGNNTTYTIIDITEDDTYYTLKSPGATYNLTATHLGYAILNNTEQYSNNTTFIDSVDIAPYVHKDNDISKKFYDELIKGQVLSYDFLINNNSQLNHTYISKYQYLTEYFILEYDTNTTWGTPTFTFNWDDLISNQPFMYVFDDATNWVWVQNLINWQLLLKYQNLSNTFINANLANLQIEQIGRWNRNISDAELTTIESAYPHVYTGVSRQYPEHKFIYPYIDMVSDLEAAGFELTDENKVIGYIPVKQNGSLIYTNQYNVIDGVMLYTKQVDLLQSNELNIIGIIVYTKDSIKLIPDYDIYNIKKVEVDIVSRNTNTPSTGSLTFQSKNIMENHDKFIINDLETTQQFRLDVNGVNKPSSTSITNYFNVSVLNTSTDVITLTSGGLHFLNTGDPIQFTGTLSTPLTIGTTYYVIKISTTEIKVATTENNAYNDINIDLTTTANFVMFRYDNKFILSNDININDGDMVTLRLAGSLPTGLYTSTNYYIIKHENRIISLADSYYNAVNNEAVTITSATSDDLLMIIDSFPINLINTKTSNEIANIFERIVNDVKRIVITPSTSSLSTNITDSVTSITLVDASSFPLSGRIRIDDEIITYSGKSSNTLTGCVRNINNSGADSHLSGSVTKTYNYDELPFFNEIYNDESYYTFEMGTEYSVFTIDNNTGIPTNKLYLTTPIDFELGDKITLTSSGTLPSDNLGVLTTGITTDPTTCYYVIPIDNSTIKIANSYNNALAYNSLDLINTGTGTHYIHVNKISVTKDILKDIEIQQNHPIYLVTTGTLPNGLSVGTKYFIIKKDKNTIEIASTLSNAQNGISINIQNNTSSGTHTLGINEVNIVSNNSAYGIVRYIDFENDMVFVEVTDGVFNTLDLLDNALSYSSTTDTVNDINNILALTCTKNNNIISVTTNLSSDLYSFTNNKIITKTNGVKSIGLSNGFTDTIIDEVAFNIGCVIPNKSLMRCFSCKVIGNI